MSALFASIFTTLAGFAALVLIYSSGRTHEKDEEKSDRMMGLGAVMLVAALTCAVWLGKATS